MLIEMKRRGPAEPGGVEELRALRQKLRAIETLLLTPTTHAVEQSSAILAEAAADLRAFDAASARTIQISSLRPEIQGLRSDLDRITALLQQAARMQLAWAQLLGAAANGYNSQGAVPGFDSGPRVSVEG